MKTLLRATNWVGDVVLSLPALKALRASFPKDELTVLARPWVADLYRARPEPDDVLVEDPKGDHRGFAGISRLAASLEERSFDRAVILPTSFGSAFTLLRARIPERIGYRGELRDFLLTRPISSSLAVGEHQVWKHLRLVEAAGADLPESPDTSWKVERGLRDSARSRLRDAGWMGEPFLAAHAASFAHQAKRWLPERFAELFDRLAGERGVAVALLGSASEAAMNRSLASALRVARPFDLSGKTSLPEALGLLAEAALFVGNDSGLAHLAAAAGTPTVVVFGPTDPDATRPWDGPRADGTPVNVRIVRSRPLCAPCRFTNCPIDHRCMADVTVEQGWLAASEVLRNVPSENSKPM
ncbi:MAG TPA: lipopolysaccharide heptosyltransferase II, partial [Thermoanaerobaculia bacterium]|nr:lipopolysaccharide heptosyltransferase II [Thermoanaerobaculia bacterium]